MRAEARPFITELRRDNERLRAAVAAVEEQNNNLAVLYAASYGLHGTVRRAEVLQAIQDVVTNLIGSEQHAIFRVRRGVLEHMASVGLDASALSAVRLDRGALATVVAGGELWIAADGVVDPTGVTVCIPLKVAGRV